MDDFTHAGGNAVPSKSADSPLRPVRRERPNFVENGKSINLLPITENELDQADEHISVEKVSTTQTTGIRVAEWRYICKLCTDGNLIRPVNSSSQKDVRYHVVYDHLRAKITGSEPSNAEPRPRQRKSKFGCYVGINLHGFKIFVTFSFFSYWVAGYAE